MGEKGPKSGKSRIVPLPATAVEMLRELRRDRVRTTDAVPTGYLFPAPDGRAWAPDNASDQFRKHVKRAKIAGASFHSLRHTHASLLLAAGVHPKVVQERLGHSTIAITMDLYSHTTPSLQAEAALSPARSGAGRRLCPRRRGRSQRR